MAWFGLFGYLADIQVESSQENNDAAFVCTVCFEPVRDREPVVSSNVFLLSDQRLVR